MLDELPWSSMRGAGVLRLLQKRHGGRLPVLHVTLAPGHAAVRVAFPQPLPDGGGGEVGDEAQEETLPSPPGRLGSTTRAPPPPGPPQATVMLDLVPAGGSGALRSAALLPTARELATFEALASGAAGLSDGDAALSAEPQLSSRVVLRAGRAPFTPPPPPPHVLVAWHPPGLGVLLEAFLDGGGGGGGGRPTAHVPAQRPVRVGCARGMCVSVSVCVWYQVERDAPFEDLVPLGHSAYLTSCCWLPLTGVL